MSKFVRFSLTGEQEGKSLVINDRYAFVNGVLEVNEADGALMKTILCEYYACKMDVIDTSVEQKIESPDASLAKSVTAKTKA